MHINIFSCIMNMDRIKYNQKIFVTGVSMISKEQYFEESKKIAEVSLIKEDIKHVLDFLKIENIYDATMQFYTEDELEELLEKTVERLTQK